ncbi:MAG: hypothetical protein Q9220_005500 [cf. Caloplaca sp. 1 TL-2023]
MQDCWSVEYCQTAAKHKHELSRLTAQAGNWETCVPSLPAVAAFAAAVAEAMAAVTDELRVALLAYNEPQSCCASSSVPENVMSAGFPKSGEVVAVASTLDTPVASVTLGGMLGVVERVVERVAK